MNVQYKYSKVHVTVFCNSQEEHVQGYRHKIHVGKSQHRIWKNLKSPVVKIERESHSSGSCLFIQISNHLRRSVDTWQQKSSVNLLKPSGERECMAAALSLSRTHNKTHACLNGFGLDRKAAVDVSVVLKWLFLIGWGTFGTCVVVCLQVWEGLVEKKKKTNIHIIHLVLVWVFFFCLFCFQHV